MLELEKSILFVGFIKRKKLFSLASNGFNSGFRYS